MNAATRREAALFLFGGVLLLGLQLVLYFHAGAMWRDEIHSVVLARLPGWLAMFHSLANDSFPGLWVCVLRLWMAAGMGAGDGWTRLLGVVLSAGVVAALWVSARWTRTSPPVLALAFAAFNPAVFYFGSSLRAYALAVCLIVLFFGAVWRVAEEPRGGWIAAGFALALLCANSNYQNSYLIFAVCVAGAAVCAARRLWKRAALILGMGLAAAVSLLPYARIIREYNAGGLIRRATVEPGAVWFQFQEAFQPAAAILVPALMLLFGLTALVAARLYARERGAADPAFRAALYGGLVVAIGGGALYRFVLLSGLPTFPWHFIPFIGLAAAALDFALDPFFVQTVFSRRARFALAAALLLASPALLWNWAHLRRTNLDLVAADVASVAVPGDFVLVSPFWNCYAFKYFYKGPAPWSILPLVPDDQIDLEFEAIRPLMTQPRPLDPAFARIRQTLSRGGRLWVVGRMPGPPEGSLPPAIGPAPDPVHGWDNVWYMQVWAMQTNYFIRRHATHFIVVPETRGRPVSPLERAEIAMAEGWKE